MRGTTAAMMALLQACAGAEDEAPRDVDPEQVTVTVTETVGLGTFDWTGECGVTFHRCQGDELPCADPAAECVDGRCMVEDDGAPQPLGEGAHGTLWPDGDVDEVTFTLDSATMALLYLCANERDRNFEPTLTLTSAAGLSVPAVLDAELLIPAGDWTLSLADAGGGGDEDFDWAMAMVRDVAPVTTEPGDADTPTAEVSLGGPVGIPFETAGDVDAFTLVVDDPWPDLAIAAVSGSAAPGTRVELVDPSGRTVSASRLVDGGAPLRFPLVSPGDYRVVVHGGDGGSPGMTVSTAGISLDAVEEVEPNDTTATATELVETFATLVGWLSGPDVDAWIPLDSDYLAVECSGPEEGSLVGRLRVELVAADGTPFATAPHQGYLPAAVRPPSLRVTSPSGGEGWYLCTVDTTPDDWGTTTD